MESSDNNHYDMDTELIGEALGILAERLLFMYIVKTNDIEKSMESVDQITDDIYQTLQDYIEFPENADDNIEEIITDRVNETIHNFGEKVE